MKKVRNYILLIALIVITIAFGVLYSKYSNLTIESDLTVISETIEEKVSKIIEISTVKYNYTDVVVYKDSKRFKGLNLPFTNKSFMIKYGGYIKAGVDLSEVEIEVIDEKTIKITMDKPIILDNVINEEDVYIYDEKESVFNKLSFTDLYEVLIEEKVKTEEEAKDRGILNEAEKNTKEIINSLLESMGFETIEITFQ